MRAYCLFFMLMVLLPFGGHAASASQSPAEVMATPCGMEGGAVIPGDGTLCEQDIAFGILYEMFPSLFNELTPLWDLTSFAQLGETPNIPMLLGEYRGDQVFFALFDLFYKLVLICILVYAGILVFSVLMRWLKGEKLVDNRSHKDSPASFAVGVGVGGSFLLPYKGFFVGQMVVFTMGIMALSMANFLSSLFLSGNQQMFIAMSSQVERESRTRPANVVDRHDYMSDLFYRNLTRYQLCRRQSSDYILTGEGGRFSTPEDYRKAASCSLPSATLVQKTKSTGLNQPGFIWTDTSMSATANGGEVLFSVGTVVQFSSRGQTLQSCEIAGESTPDYDCGAFEVLMPDWSKNPLVRLYGEDAGDFIGRHLSALRSKVSPSQSAGSIKSSLDAGWSALRQDLLEKFAESWLASKQSGPMTELVTVNDKVMQRKDALQLSMLDNARPHLQQAAQFYHQAAMNMLMFGDDFKYRKMDDEAVTSGGEHWSSLMYHAGVADQFAEVVSRVQCMNYKYDLHKSEETARFLRGEAQTLMADSSARCLDVAKAQVLEYDAAYPTKTQDVIRAEAESRVNTLSVELKNAWQKNVTTLSAQRRAVESAFETAVGDETSDAWWVSMRQQGYLAGADYAQSMNNRVNGYKRDLKQILNNFTQRPAMFDGRYISQALEGAYSVDAKFIPFRDAGDQVFAGTRLTQGRMDPMIGNSQWIVEQENLLREDPTGLDDSVFDMVNRMVTMPQNYLQRLGIGLTAESKDQDKCLENPSFCPFPLTDPLVELSLMGHDMVDVAVAFYAAAVPIKLVSGAWAEKARMRRTSGGKVSDIGFMDRLEKSLSGDGPTSKLVGAVLSLAKGMMSAAAVLDMVFDLFSSIMAVFLGVGLALAYLLPLLPKIYLYLNFISWLTVVVMGSFAVLLWSVFWIRFTEKKDLLKSAGFHYGVEILFKPSFSLIAVIFAWYFFYVIAYLVGMSLGWVWSVPMDEGNFLRGLFDTAVVVILISFIYLIGLKYAYQLMSDLSGELLRILGVNDSKQKDKISELVKVILYDQARRATDSGTQWLDRNAGRDAGKQYLMNRAQQSQMLAKDHNKGYQDEMRRLNGGQGGSS